ncbi:MAG: CDP-alcohol phosphatidyltransferase family protein [Pirellulales bacterium]
MDQPDSVRPTLRQSLLAMLAHIYTASGLIPLFWAATGIVNHNFQAAYLGFLIAVFIDATDGTLARAVDVKRNAPWINGRKLDDIVDYLGYTFLPILLAWKAGWFLSPAYFWVCWPLLGSIFAFVHEGAKEEDLGFFRGFPSYWNIVVFYIDIFYQPGNEALVTYLLAFLGVMCIMPIRFVYPTLPPCWKGFFLGGATVWGVQLLVMAMYYPDIPDWMTYLSLVYPVIYTVLSIYLDWHERLTRKTRQSLHHE